MSVTIYTSPLAHLHDTGEGHPECAARAQALQDLFQTAPFKDWPQKQATPAELEHIFLAHEEDYVFDLQDKTPDQGLHYIDGDTILSPNSFDAALYSAGAVINAVDDILSQPNNASPQTNQRPPACGHDCQIKRAFCATRPPGHHAEPNTAMGFCFFNNVFIGARYAQEKYDINRIAILDFDVHHGNGTETMTRRHNKAHPDKPIFYISSHGYPLFPMTGDPADNNETLLNVRLPNDCNSETFQKTYIEQVFPNLERFNPELTLISSGFDAHIDDPLANIRLKSDDFAFIAKNLNIISQKSCQNRLISVLEGGYHIPSLTESVRLYLEEYVI